MSTPTGFQDETWQQNVDLAANLPASQIRSQQIANLQRRLLTLQLHSLVLNQELPPALPVYTENVSGNPVPYQIPAPHTYTLDIPQGRDLAKPQHGGAGHSEAIVDLQARQLLDTLTDKYLQPALPPQNTQLHPPQTITIPRPDLGFQSVCFANRQGQILRYSPLAGIHRYPTSATKFPSGQSGGGFPTIPVFAPPSIQSTHLPARLPARTTPSFYQYGDCGESLPLAAMTNIWRTTARAEIRSVAAFVTKLRGEPSIPEDGRINASIRLRDPCLNCKSLMQRFPGTVTMLAGSGYSENICWMIGNQPMYVSDVYSAPQPPLPPRRYDNFLLAAAYGAGKEQIYSMLQTYVLVNRNPFLSEELRNSLVEVWCSLVVPYRDHGAVFRINADDNVQPLIVTINGVKTPLCSVFCAIGFILSTILWPTRVDAQRQVSFLPLMAVLAKWCYTLCPWGHPNVVSVAYTSSQGPGADIGFLLGTSKPSTKEGVGPEINSKHSSQMRIIRRALLEGYFGRLPEPCPQKVAAEY